MGKKLNDHLSDELKDKFEVQGELEYLHFSQAPWGEVNLKTMGVEQATELVNRGFPYLKPKAETTEKTKPKQQ